MTQNTGGFPPSSGGRATQSSMPDAAREEAANVGHSIREAGGHVAETTAEQAKQVAAETTRQARDLLGEARGQAREQASAQQQKVAQQLRTLADELNEMAAKTDQPGMAAELARQASERIHGGASWLEKREPGDLLDEVRAFARRRPGVFLLGAALAGVVAGRLTRGVASAASGGQAEPPQPASAATTPGPHSPTVAGPAVTPTMPGYGASGVSGPSAGGMSGGGATTSGRLSSRPGQP